MEAKALWCLKNAIYFKVRFSTLLALIWVIIENDTWCKILPVCIQNLRQSPPFENQQERLITQEVSERKMINDYNVLFLVLLQEWNLLLLSSKYWLLHISKNDEGSLAMKSAPWSIVPRTR